MRKPTEKQILRAHLIEHHRALVRRSRIAGESGWQRATLATLQRSHRADHHRHSGALDHFHQGDGEAPNFGPESRPQGWRTGEDVRVKSAR